MPDTGRPIGGDPAHGPWWARPQTVVTEEDGRLRQLGTGETAVRFRGRIPAAEWLPVRPLPGGGLPPSVWRPTRRRREHRGDGFAVVSADGGRDCFYLTVAEPCAVEYDDHDGDGLDAGARRVRLSGPADVYYRWAGRQSARGAWAMR